MTDTHRILARIRRGIGYLLVGVVVTAGVALGTLYVGQPLQRLIYDVFYLQLGPSDATQTAILAHFLFGGFAGLAAALLAGDYVDDRLRRWPALLRGIALLGGFLLAFLIIGAAQLAAFLTALVAVAVAVITVPLVLRSRYEVASGGLTAFIGGVPVLVLLLLLAGFGLGWGWGYTMTATEVPASAVDRPVEASLDEAPEVRAELLSGPCDTNPDGRRTCRLYLRGSPNEVAATRFMARHGVRCPYQSGATDPAGSFIAQDGDTYYRISCSPHGD